MTTDQILKIATEFVMDEFNTWFKKLCATIKSRDLSFWSTISTLLLEGITLFLAFATNKMANVMMMDFKVRNMPIFWTSTPILEIDNALTKISFSIKNASTGIANNAIHSVMLMNNSDQLVLPENTIIRSGKWSKKLYEIPFDYSSGQQQNIKLNWPKLEVPPEQLKAIVIILAYDTLFDDKRRQFADGYLYESDHNNFDPMTKDFLNPILEKGSNENLIK